jgi:hypothetical protein
MPNLRLRGLDRARGHGRTERGKQQLSPPQVSGTCGFFSVVGPNTHSAAFPLQVIESAATNPGCPDCGYLGWRSLNDEAVPQQTRFAAGRPRTHLA